MGKELGEMKCWKCLRLRTRIKKISNVNRYNDLVTVDKIENSLLHQMLVRLSVC